MTGEAQAGGSRTRPTPFAMGLPGRVWAEARFAAIEAEAISRGSDLGDPAAFMMLSQVGASLQDLRPDDDETSPELFHTFGSFLFHAFHLLHGGTPGLLLDLEPVAARYLVEAQATPDGWDSSLPARAGYLRLPPHLFWTRPGGESAPAEAIDGISWCTSSQGVAVREPEGNKAEPGAESGLALVVITGVRGDRPGFSVLPLPAVPLADVGSWLVRKARTDNAGEDFQTTLPGGELGNLYSVETTGEVLKLVARALGYAMTVPGAMSVVSSPPPIPRKATPEADEGDDSRNARPGDDSRAEPRPADSGLAFATIRLVGSS